MAVREGAATAGADLRRAGVSAVLLGALVACSSVDLYPITRDGGTSLGEGGADAAAPRNCPSPPTGDSAHSVVVDGVTRGYVLHVPASHDAASPAPLVVDFHGIGESGASERQDSPYPAVLDREGVLMAFPDGLRGPAGAGWNVGPCCVADVDDVAFARAVVADVRARACVDSSRVYAVGVLTGGGLAHYLGCHAADAFAAVAPAAFDLLEENQDDCLPSRPVTVVSFRSTRDPRVPYAGGDSSLVPGMPLTFLGARATFAKWAELDGCSGSASAEDQHGCSAYSGCAGGAEVILCTRDGEVQQGDAEIAWPILRAHTL